jgi:DNA repair protein RecN (Recombination protein N)
MLTQITISQFTVVDELDVEFGDGLTVITGETGAGKSIVLDALGLCLGDRADPKAIRPGATRAEIHARFSIANIGAARSWLAERDLDDGDELLLRRVINSDGRSRAYINGRPATLQDCTQLGEYLIDIHGQHAHQALLRRSAQRALLDALAGATAHAAGVRDTAQRWQALRGQLARLRDEHGANADREQLLRYQLEELASLALADGELEALESELRQLENAETIQRQAAAAIEHCEAGAGAGRRALSELDPALHAGGSVANVREMLESAAIQLEEARGELTQYLADRESNPQRLGEINERLEAIYSAARKHRVLPEQLPGLQGELAEELAGIDSSDERLAALEGEAQALADTWYEHARRLSDARSKAARQLQRDVGKVLAQLAMGGCSFRAALTPRGEQEPHPLGAEEVDFLISTNPGAAEQALARVASGGELSRISLAIQVVAAGRDASPTMVFDEVDVGIGGAVAEVVGRLLADIATHAQVLCVTHLPQVAAQGGRHLLVEKHTHRKRVASRLRLLDDAERVEEIARMLGGLEVTGQTRAHAREMLDVAAS